MLYYFAYNFMVKHRLHNVLHIFSYRLQIAIMNQCKTTSLSQQIELNLMDFHRAVDIHRAFMLVI